MARKAGPAGRGDRRLAARGDAKRGFTHTTHYNVVPGYAAGSRSAQVLRNWCQAHQRAVARHPSSRTYPSLSGRAGTSGLGKATAGLGQKPGWYYPDRTPEQLRRSCAESAIAWMDQRIRSRQLPSAIVLLYAWNEFGEGGYLAPTKGNPGSLLEGRETRGRT